MMTQLLYAVVVGVTLASTALVIGLPEWAAPLIYVIGMGATLLGRPQRATTGKALPKPSMI